MSDSWYTYIYFPPTAEISTALFTDLFRRLATAGAPFPPAGKGLRLWTNYDSALEDSPVEVTTLDEVLARTREYGSGSILWTDARTEMELMLDFHPSGSPFLPQELANGRFGSIGLYIDYTFLRWDPPSVTRQRYRDIFAYSNALAQTPGAIYGWGDVEGTTGYGERSVPAAALEAGEIPRLAWWNFFSSDLANRIGMHRLYSSLVYTKVQPHGVTIVFLPEGDERPTVKDVHGSFV